MRRADPDHGWLLCFLLNLLLRLEWLALALILWALRSLLPLPRFLPWAALAVWVVLALALTFLVSWGNRCGQGVTYRPNRNPYSVKSDAIPVNKEEEQ